MGLKKLNQGLKKAEKVKNSDQTSDQTSCAIHTHNSARRALGWCIRARASLFCAKITRRRPSSKRQPPWTSVFGATRVDPWYLYEASLEIVGFVLLHKVPKEKTDQRVF